MGSAISHYTILEKLGEGGMGVVYKARDQRLDRFVAIKLLPPDKASDAARRARFFQEAKAASSLNHPSIVTIHDIVSEAGQDCIVMEYVAGKTLARLIPRRGMPLEEALAIAMQIADALARAHAAGIVHRDLKPANVMVDDHGLVKILDFGLAKLSERTISESESTETAAVKTDEGAIVGTAAYMSPEQAEARPADARSDIFSFGAVLYEMLTGARAFKGDSRVSTLVEVLRSEPAPLPPEAPREIDRIVRRCLRKDPSKRFQNMADLKVALSEIKEESDSGALAASGVGAALPRRRGPWLPAAAGLLLLALGGGAWWRFARSGGAADVPLRAVPLTTYEGGETGPSFSPDGEQVAFSWTAADAPRGIYVKMIGSEAAQRRTASPPTSMDLGPAWSPDGRWIAFLRVVFPKQRILVVPSIGGPERTVAEVTIPNPVSTGILGPYIEWSADSQWLIVVDRPRGREAALFAVSIATGERRQITSPPQGTNGDTAPALSPDGRTLGFVRNSGPLVADLYLVSLSAGMTPRGEPKRLTSDNQWTGKIAWSADGREIVYCAGAPSSLWRFKASGKDRPRRLALGPEDASAPTISRRNSRLAYVRSASDFDIYRADLVNPAGPAGPPLRTVSSTLMDEQPQLSSDGARIAFVSNRSGALEVWVCGSDGSNPSQLTSFGGPPVYHPVWSPDGKQIVFESNAGGKWAAYVIFAQGGASRQLNSAPSGHPSSWSRDGK
ncbi:MAG: serine/threonine-protein kinase [Acidobacteriia bacterium]|nr:serine/threonine-protein kinase [Terriglobia bacterium]